MEENINIIRKFYDAFKNHDGDAMAACYHEEASFNDPAFVGLKGEEPGMMWKMLLSRSNTLQISYSDEWSDGNRGGAKWEAKYEFGPQKRKVHNKITAQFEFKDGLIIKHIDTFDFWKWSRMALGLPGILLGWSPFLKGKVQKQVRGLLNNFISSQAN